MDCITVLVLDTQKPDFKNKCLFQPNERTGSFILHKYCYYNYLVTYRFICILVLAWDRLSIRTYLSPRHLKFQLIMLNLLFQTNCVWIGHDQARNRAPGVNCPVSSHSFTHPARSRRTRRKRRLCCSTVLTVI